MIIKGKGIREEFCYLVILKARHPFGKHLTDKEGIGKVMQGYPVHGVVIERSHILFYWVGGINRVQVMKIKREVSGYVLRGRKYLNSCDVFKEGYDIATIGMPDFESVGKYINSK